MGKRGWWWMLAVAVVGACSSSDPSSTTPEIGPTARPISGVSVIGPTSVWANAWCSKPADAVIDVTEATDRAITLTSTGTWPELDCAAAFLERVEFDEPIAGRLILDGASGEVIGDGRFWNGMPLVAVEDGSWSVADIGFEPDLPATPEPLDPMRWAVTYERAGVEVVVESFTDTAAEVAFTDPDADPGLHVDTAPGWSVRIRSSDPSAAAEVVDLLVDVTDAQWRDHVGVEWGER
ncbi:MAG: hypothetical protein AAGD18_08420 [Actinomycetota bacterium]